MVDLTRRLADLSPAKRRLLQQRLRETAVSAGGTIDHPIVAAGREARRTLSFGQERLWFLSELEPDTPVYNIPAVVRLRGRLDRRALLRSVALVARRHRVLRAVFVATEEGPEQDFLPPSSLRHPVVDLSALPDGARTAQMEALVAAEANRPFELAVGPPLRSHLVACGPDDHLLVLVVHHIVADGWSIGVLVREISTLYAAEVEGAPAELPELPLQYADFAVWQRERLSGETLDAHLDYWGRRLADPPALVTFPADRPRPTRAVSRGGHLPFRLAPVEADGVRRLARERSVSLFSVLAAAFQVLLARHTGLRDLVVGFPVANRNRVELEGLVGLFVNTLVLRTDLAGDPGLPEVLDQVHEAVLSAQTYQELPFERLVDHLQPERSLSQAPLFQVMLGFQPAALASGEVAGLSLEPMAVQSGTAKFDLVLLLEEHGDRIEGTCSYSASLYDRTTIERVLRRFRALLASAVREPDGPVFELAMLPAGERQQVLSEWSAGGSLPAGASPTPIPWRFVEAARRTPDAVALVAGGARLTYGELERRCHRLAHALLRRGAGPERPIGVLLERTPDLVVSLLAVLEAGAGYLPLDPSNPSGRLEMMLEDAGAEIVLVDGSTSGLLPPGRAALDLDAARPELARESVEAPGVSVDPGALAYLIYTSGSTGTPKGVAIEHRSAAALLDWAGAAFSAAELAGVLAATSVGFDLSVFELFVPLTTGGTVVLADSVLALDGLEARDAVRLINTVPSAVTELLHRGAIPDSVLCIDLAGEPFPHDLAAELLERSRIDRVLNLYGPSEDTTYSTFGPVEAGERPSIGRPVAGSSVLLLDRWLAPVPVGSTGELCLAGAGLARGYLRRPGLTAERFVPNPFAEGPGERLYRTGDLARWRTDGRIDFLGRFDHQVKVRGFRIELGEVEAALSRHPGVREAVVTVSEGPEAGKLLVAHVLAGDGVAPALSDLRRFLLGELPDYMVPAAFLPAESFPRTASGKVDRRRLAERVGSVEPARETPYEAPRTSREKQIAALWADLLGRERVGARDNFFELGGHSLLAARFTVKLRAETGLDVPLSQVFEAPTVAELAAALRGADGGRELPPIEPVDRRGPLPLSFAQERLWFLDRFDRGSSTLNLPAAVSIRGPLQVGLLGRSLDELVRRHEILRTVFFEVDGRPRQVVHPARGLELPLIDLADISDPRTAAQRLEALERERIFDLERGPLLAARLLRLAPEEHRLLLTLHHIVTDGWSMGLLTRELTVLYDAMCRGEPSPLPVPPIQYGDYADWQRRILTDRALAQGVDTWRRRLAGAPEALDLPTDRPRPAVQSYRGAGHRFAVPAALARELEALGVRERASLFMVLLAGFEVVLARWSGQNDLVVGTPIAGRDAQGLDSVVGLFLNSLALRTDLSGEPTFRELLGRVRDAALEAYALREVPFERVLEAVKPERDLSRTPIFQVFFNMLNFPAGPATVEGLAIEARSTPELPSKFDLTVYALEREGSISFDLVFNAGLFDRPTIEHLAGQYLSVLAQAVGEGERPVHRFDLVTDEARAVLPDPASVLGDGWHGAVHEVFSRIAREAPERTAVAGAGASWSYGALESQANRFAHLLIERGVRPGRTVVIHGHRSAPLVWIVLGVLKAGAAFVVLDPSYPEERLIACTALAAPAAWVEMAAAGAPAPEVAAFVDALEGCERVAVADDLSLAGYPDGAPEVAVGRDDPAVLGFTSGSTGVPKGIIGRHGPLSYFIPWQREQFGLGPDDRFSMVSALAHDPLQRDLFTPLQIGASLWIPDPEQMAEPGWLARWMADSGVTVAHMTPAMGQVLTEGVERDRATAPSLRYFFLVGEALTRRDVDRLERLAPSATCVNLYGSTETQRSVGFHVVERVAGDGTAREVLPLGRGVEDVQLLVRTPAGDPAGIGELGEVAVRSHHLAEGYLGDPELSRRRFIPNPHRRDPRDRLYLTGDLGRHTHDGSVVFAGRVDHQVKVRGFRIELSEIEAVLGRHPGVGEVAVALREDVAGDRRLVAYCVAGNGALPEPAVLRDFARRRLPDYMVPAAFVPMARLPLTANRKIDRRALPAPVVEEAHETVAPRDSVERQVFEIWSELLGNKRFGVHDDFFDLGGHSLLATRLAAALRERAGVDLPLKELFQAPTVAGMAGAVASRREEPAPPEEGLSPEPIVPDPAEAGRPFPLTDVQQAYWVGRSGAFDLGSVSTHVYFEIEAGALDLPRLEVAWRRLIDRHGMLRMIVRPDGLQQVLDQVPPYTIDVLDLRRAGAAERDASLAQVRSRMSHQVLPSDRWPLFELRASRLPSGRTRVHASFDLLMADALSFRILERELLTLYEQPDAVLPPLELSFRDYVLGLVELEKTELFRRSLDYWRGRLADLPPAPELPLVGDPSTLQELRFVRRSGGLDAAAWSRLKRRAARAGLTPSGLVAAAFAEVLATWSKSPRFTINLTLFNRMPLHPQVDRIVGDFTSLVLLEVDGAGLGTFEERARRVQDQLWSDLDHRHVSGVRVLREVHSGSSGTAAGMPVVFTSTLSLPERKGSALRRAIEGEVVFGISQTPQVWLDHQVAEVDGALRLTWDAIEELFPEGLLDDAWTSYGHFLHELADGEGAWHDPALTLVPASHLALFAEANATEAEAPGGLLHEPFLEQARRQPERPAVLAGGVSLSYSELEARSRRLATVLRGAGVGPNELVAVAMEKGWEQVVAVLGVLRAGAAYLPLGSDLPEERFRFLLEHGDCAVVLGRGASLGSLAVPSGVRTIAVDELSPAPDDEPAPGPIAGPRDLAYVIFTSGSTGRPKGVMIDHLGALNTVTDVDRRFGLGPDDRVLALSALSFDLSVWDVFGMLGAGGALVLPEPEAARDPRRWQELIERYGVTVWNTVPALMEMLVEYVEGQGDADLRSLRLVMMSGDWIPVTLPGRIGRLSPEAEVASLGGATEASIWSIHYPVGDVPPEWRSIPYGRAMVNQSFHVLDGAHRPRPLWVPGELYIGGIGLARGYWKAPEKTAASFFDHPRTHERLYRTGDLGRFLPSGDIEFLGREDFQVKIRGYRIELGEIEAVLADHPEVRSCAVAVVGEGERRRLAAFIVPAAGPDGDGPAPATLPADAPDAGAIEHHLERLELKLEQRAVRRDLDGASVPLAVPPADESLLERYRARSTERSFARSAVALEALEALLGSLMQVQLPGRPLPKLRYPSAGNLYPVQVYLHARPDRVAGLEGGTYYYHPKEHRLLRLGDGGELNAEIHAEVNREVFRRAAFQLFLVADLDAIEPLYGEGSRDLCLVEAGAMAQLLMEEAPGAGVGLCPIGRLRTEPLGAALRLGPSHSFLLGLLGGRSLRASRTPAEDGDGLAGRLRERLREALPHYMVPSTISVLDSLPLTANGKVDRRALIGLAAEPDVRRGEDERKPAAAAEAGARFVAEGALVEQVTRILREVLEVDRVAPNESFFELGGTSVHIVRVHARLRDELGVDLPIVEIFNNPTAGSLARRLAREGGAEAAGSAPPGGGDGQRREPRESDEPEGTRSVYQALRRRRLGPSDDRGGEQE